jgi:hypothetical protein
MRCASARKRLTGCPKGNARRPYPRGMSAAPPASRPFDRSRRAVKPQRRRDIPRGRLCTGHAPELAAPTGARRTAFPARRRQIEMARLWTPGANLTRQFDFDRYFLNRSRDAIATEIADKAVGSDPHDAPLLGRGELIGGANRRPSGSVRLMVIRGARGPFGVTFGLV